MTKARRISLILGVVIMSLAVGYLAVAWSDAPGAPPTCPSGYPGCDAPVHVGSTGQTKAGGLNILGSVGIGTSDVGAKTLKVQGDVEFTGSLTVGGNPNTCQLVSFTGSSGTTNCPNGYYTLAAPARESGTMLCCKVSNPI
jgi:hypothetical protein